MDRIASTVEARAQTTGFNWPTLLWVSSMHIGAIAALFFSSWENFTALMVMYVITGCFGITLTYHRLLAHRSFTVPKWFERILTTFGALAMQGGPLKWSSQHRMHHSNPDTERDPHSSLRGFFYCHLGWTMLRRPEFDDAEKLRKFGRDIYNDPYYRWLETTMGQFLPQLALGLILFSIGGLSMVLWGVCLRMVLVYHATWCVNSATHFFGYRNYDVNDKSRNTWWVALITFGEGWHNNHHAHQHFAEAGHKWWEIDVTMMVIRSLEFVGLASKIKSFKVQQSAIVAD
ncbi:MAG: fatty acid desaturase [Proteobacteria bacterium]|nr:fatty acid desaturase [Pseudomonadota bacterium]